MTEIKLTTRKIIRSNKRFVIYLLWGIIIAALIFGALLLPIILHPASYAINQGEVSPYDIQAPSDIVYFSDELTQRAKDVAENSISNVYLPADPGITRRQIERLRLSVAYINSVRADTYASQDQKIADLSHMVDVSINADMALKILNISDTRWETVNLEAMNVLEQVMRTTIRTDRLNDARRNISTLIDLSLPESQATLVSELVTPFVVPNSLVSSEQTELAIEQAVEDVIQVEKVYVAGETIIQRGQIVSPLVWEALQQFGLVKRQQETQFIFGSVIFSLFISALFLYYIRFRRANQFQNYRSIALVLITFFIILYSMRMVIPDHTVLPYLFPVAAFGLAISSLFVLEIGIVFSLALAVLGAFGLEQSLSLTIYYSLPVIIGMLVLGKGRRISTFLWTGVLISLAGSAIILGYRFTEMNTDLIGILTLLGASFFYGIASAIAAMVLQYIFAQILGVTTTLQLLEISRPDHPLLQHMLVNAPGTYQHSLQVANLAEQAARAIGADALLVRVGALFHDAGKSMNPLFFIENQVRSEINTHDELDPISSSKIIVEHVNDGIVLAKKHRLPNRIHDFVLEHHGTLVTRYQYMKAVQAAGNDPSKVDLADFQYPGPKPRSRETALIMLADGCEARARAEMPKSEDDLKSIVRKVFEFCQTEGQLDNTTFTLRDLHLAMESFASTLKNTYHPRIEYPKMQPEAKTIKQIRHAKDNKSD
ncbi:MAG: HDIG domain-containing protein [Anaerolineaceae bacterium]|nr:HDIG domain-containing protein [Anaerolineaceae bacterium]